MKNLFLSAIFALLFCTATFAETRFLNPMLCDSAAQNGQVQAFVMMSIAG